jgi:hypothetical protein
MQTAKVSGGESEGKSKGDSPRCPLCRTIIVSSFSTTLNGVMPL